MRTEARVLCLAVAVAAAGSPAAAAGLTEWAIHAGSFNVTKRPTAAEAGFELRFATRWQGLDATAGAAGTEDGGLWVYGGARYTFELDRRWAFSPGFGIALYEPGDGKELGGAIEFRSSFELSCRLGRRGRLGLIFYHLSNAGFYDLNPGSNSAVLAWSVGRGS